MIIAEYFNFQVVCASAKNLHTSRAELTDYMRTVPCALLYVNERRDIHFCPPLTLECVFRKK